jgi:hypothetical protein
VIPAMYDPNLTIPKCATDRSVAIAHDLESTFWEQVPWDELPKAKSGRTAKNTAGKKAKTKTLGAILEPEEEISKEEQAPTQGTGKWRPKQVSSEQLQQLIATRTSPAVKAALVALVSGGAKKKAKKVSRI